MNKDIESLNRVFFKFVCACGYETSFTYHEYEQCLKEIRGETYSLESIENRYYCGSGVHSSMPDRSKLDYLYDVARKAIMQTKESPIERIFHHFGITKIRSESERYICSGCKDKYTKALEKMELAKNRLADRLEG
jgi:hypothetical protein